MSYLTSPRLVEIDRLIGSGTTGSPSEFAAKLGISERALYDQLAWLRAEGRCPIRYCRTRRSYIYSRPGRLVLAFWRNSSPGPQFPKKWLSGGSL